LGYRFSIRCRDEEFTSGLSIRISVPGHAEAAKNQVPTIVAEIPDTGRLKVTNLDDGA